MICFYVFSDKTKYFWKDRIIFVRWVLKNLLENIWQALDSDNDHIVT